MVLMQMYNMAATSTAETIRNKDFFGEKLYSSAACGIQSKPINAQGVMATTAKMQANGVLLSAVWNAGIRLEKSWQRNKTIAVTKTMETTKSRETKVCNAPDSFTPLMFR